MYLPILSHATSFISKFMMSRKSHVMWCNDVNAHIWIYSEKIHDTGTECLWCIYITDIIKLVNIQKIVSSQCSKDFCNTWGNVVSLPKRCRLSYFIWWSLPLIIWEYRSKFRIWVSSWPVIELKQETIIKRSTYH